MSDDEPTAPATFPANIVWTLATHFAENCTGLDAVVRRPLNPTDPSCSLGVIADAWLPRDWEIRGGSYNEPTVSRYQVQLQLLVKHAVEEDGYELHSLLTKSIRTMLVRDSGLRVALLAISETSFDVTERLKKYWVTRQQFMSNRVRTEFMFLSLTDVAFEVETV